MAVRCPYCGYPNFPDAKKCRRCSKELPDLCPTCGAVLQSQATFCSACGELFDRKWSDVPVSKEAQKRSVVKKLDRAPTFVGPRPKDLKPCPICNHFIAVDAPFCTYCGNRFSKDAASAEQPAQAPAPQEDLSTQQVQQTIREAAAKEKKEAEKGLPIGKKAIPGKPGAQVPPQVGKKLVKKKIIQKPAGPGVPKPAGARPQPPVPGKTVPIPRPSKLAAKPGEGKSQPRPPESKLPPRPLKKVTAEQSKPEPKQPEVAEVQEPKPVTADSSEIQAQEKLQVSASVNPEKIMDQVPVEPPVEEARPDKPEPQPVATEETKPISVDKPLEKEPDFDDSEEAEKLRASRIAIRDVKSREAKIRSPFEIPTYIEREYPPVPPQYSSNGSESAAPPPGMVLIPGGPFMSGPEKTESTLPSFLIDIFPVTCQEYLKFCEETRHRKPWNWVHTRYAPGRDQHPVTYVNLNDARAFAAWANKRLLTDLEWEKAAGGEDGRLYPWGNDFLPERCLCRNGRKPKTTVPVDSFPEGASPYGIMDMIGNACEWTESEDISSNPEAGPILRGGSLADSCELISCRVQMIGGNPEQISPFIGFRCAKDV